MNYYDIAHSFFYDNESMGRGCGSYSSRLWYSKPWSWEQKKGIIMQAYSYSTVIAERRLNKQGREVCIISDKKYSNTTAKHLSYLRQACPTDYIYVPYVYGGVNDAFMSRFERYIAKGFDENIFRRKENRDEFLYLLRMFDEYEHEIGTTKKLRGIRSRKTIKYYEELCHAINQDRKNVANMSEAARKKYERKQAKEKAQRERTKKLVDKFMKSKDQNEKLQAAFKYNYYMDDQLKALHNALTKGRGYAYVWVDEDCHKVCTSKHVNVSIEDVQRLLRIWHAKERLIGEKCSCYTIVENTNDHVKIGCHTIPQWNVQMLYNKLIAA